MEQAHYTYLLNNFTSADEISLVCQNSIPKRASRFFVSHKNFNFETFDFDFVVKNDEAVILIPFSYKNSTLNKFKIFLNEMENSFEPLLFYIFNKGVEYLIYYSKINNHDVRFLFLNTSELNQKEKEGKILSYSYLEAEILFDILINKKILVKKIQDEIENIINKYNNIAYFEQKSINI